MQWLVACDALREKESFDPIDVADPLGGKFSALPDQSASVFLLWCYVSHHRADTRLSTLERQQRSHQGLAVDPVGFGSTRTARHRDGGRINDMALDSGLAQRPVDPETVKSSFLNGDDRKTLAEARSGLLPKFLEPVEEARKIAAFYGMLRHFLTTARYNRCDQPLRL
jgi:hypothetical protein